MALSEHPKKISLIMTPVTIILGAIGNGWSYMLLKDIFIKQKISSYEKLVYKVLDKKWSIFLFISINIYNIGLVLVYQVLIYKLIGGLVNIFGGYDEPSMTDFLENTFWKEMKWKFIINFSISIIILFPFCLIKDMSILNFSSMLGVFSLIYVVLVIIIQFRWYYIDYKDNYYIENDESTHLKITNIKIGFDSEFQFFQCLGELFFCYTGHNGFFPVIDSVENPTNKRLNYLIYLSFIVDIIIYLIISIFGYLTSPLEELDLVIERKKLIYKDIAMTIGRILLLFLSFTKVPVNLNTFRVSLLGILNMNIKDMSNKFNVIFISSCLLITTLLASVYQKLSTYMSLIGSFLVVFPAFLYPALLWNKLSDLPKYHWKKICNLVCAVILCIIGYISGVMVIVDMAKD